MRTGEASGALNDDLLASRGAIEGSQSAEGEYYHSPQRTRLALQHGGSVAREFSRGGDALGQMMHEPCNFRKSDDDARARRVGSMSPAIEGEKRVGAGRGEIDVTNEDRTALYTIRS